MPKPYVIAIAGVAGSGKSTLGRALAVHLGAPLLDLDTLTNPLLDALHDSPPGEHWLSSSRGETIRAARYRALRSVARDVIGTAGCARCSWRPSPPKGLTGGEDWRALGVDMAPADVVVVRIVGDPELLAQRRTYRGEPRDAHRGTDITPPVGVPTLSPWTPTCRRLGGKPLVSCRVSDAAERSTRRAQSLRTVSTRFSSISTARSSIRRRR